MDEMISQAGPTDADPPFRVLIAYNDLAAGRRAMHLLADVGRTSGNEIEFQPLLWSFAELADANRCNVASNDAVSANLLILATSDTKPLTPAIGGWVEKVISRKQGSAAAVVALFGPGEHPDEAGSSRLEALRTAARRAGLDFFAPAPREELNEAISQIHQRTELITPLLDEILRHQSTSRRDSHIEAP